MTMVTQNNASDPLPVSGQPLSEEVQGNANTLRLPPSPPIPQVPLKPGSVPCFLSFAHPEFPPLPFSPFPDLTLYQLADDLFIYDDREVDYVQLRAEAQEASLAEAGEDTIASASSRTGVLSGTQSNALTIERAGDGLVKLEGELENNACYALLSNTDLNQQSWQVEDVFRAPPDGTWHRGPFAATLPQKFYVLLKDPPLPMVWVECYCDALIGSGHNGKFLVRRKGCDNSGALTVYLLVGGTATRGHNCPPADYYLPIGFGNPIHVTIEPGSSFAEVEVVAFNEAQIESPYETVTLTLTPNPYYYINPRYGTATVKICRDLFECAVSGLGGPIGIDYYPIEGNQALLISDNFWNGGLPWNFTKIFKVGGNIQCVNWSSISGLCDEIKVTTVKQSVGNFLLGDVFFGHKPANDQQWTRIGRITAGGTSWDTNWAILPGETSPVHGGLYVDQTGLFNYDLIVVTGGLPREGGTVWRISSNPDHSSNTKTVFAQVQNAHLEGVITLPDDPVKYGPWTGKILTGDESHQTGTERDPIIYAINQVGTVEEFHLQIAPEDFDVIKPGQNLYCNYPCLVSGCGSIWKVPSWYFCEHLGDILVTQAGEVGGAPILEDGQALLVVIHWDAEEGRFVQKVIFPPYWVSTLEHVSFAPIDL